MFVRAANRLRAGVGGAARDHYFQRGRARAEIRVTLTESAARAPSRISLPTFKIPKSTPHASLTNTPNQLLRYIFFNDYDTVSTSPPSKRNSRSLDTPHITGHWGHKLSRTRGRGHGAARRAVGIQTAGAARAAAALTSRAGYSHGGATRTAPPPSRSRRAPARLFSVPKIQDSDPPFRSRRMFRPPPVTLPHANLITDGDRGGSMRKITSIDTPAVNDKKISGHPCPVSSASHLG